MEGLYKYHRLPLILHRALEPRGGDEREKKEKQNAAFTVPWNQPGHLLQPWGGHLREDLDSMQQA